MTEPRDHICRALPAHIPPSPTNTRWMWVEGVYFKHYNRQVSPLGDELKPEDVDHLIIRSGFADCYHYFKRCTFLVRDKWYSFQNNDKTKGVRVAA